MATIVLTTVGTLIGGPIGGAVGAILGQTADQAVFAPKARQGPRLGDLAVQTSSYGSQLPKLFGTMRVAGTIIWATDLIENRTSSGGGKGRPKTVGYSYAANFAVALSARPVRAVRRIWADGKLLRGVEGDFKSKLGDFRLHSGDEDQTSDPLISSAEGAGLCPAYRGLAYAVFEELQLEDFGNRIPSLSFEIEADAEPVSAGTIAAELSGNRIAAGAATAVAGYAASGYSVRSAIEALAEPLGLTLCEAGGELTLQHVVGPAAATIPAAAQDGSFEISRRGEGSVPVEVTITYYDPARDHQAGLQRASRGAGAALVERLGLAAAIDPDNAKAFAESRLAALWAARSTAKLRLGWQFLELRPGTAVSIEPEAGLWRIDRQLVGPMIVDLELTRLTPPGAALPVSQASAGRPVAQQDLVHGPTLLSLFDLPLSGEGASGGGETPTLFALAAGPREGWRRALLSASFDNGASWADIGATGAPAILGEALSSLEPAGSTVIDAANSVDVELLHAGMAIEERDDTALADGANLAVLGRELIQFGRADRIGEKRYRLSRLLRGRRGTEWAASAHAAGETFALLDRASVLPVPVAAGAAGAEARLVAVGIGDDAAGTTASCLVTAEALRPPSPVHLRAQQDGAGGLHVTWARRSRAGWAWTSGADTPLGEEQERYRVTLEFGVEQHVVEVGQPRLLFTAADLAGLGLTTPLSIAVVQLGTHGVSRAAQATISEI